jgi:serine/threonine-protein kinase RsbW
MHNGPVSEKWHEEELHTAVDMNVVNDRILAMMAAAGFADKDLFGMRLALEEATVNALKHGNSGDSGKSVYVRFRITAQQAMIEIEDQGPGFIPEDIPDPLAPENLERPSGRGLFLMRYYMTWVKYNERGNCVCLCKERNPNDA